VDCAGSSLEAALAKLGLTTSDQMALQVNLSSDTLTSANEDDTGRPMLSAEPDPFGSETFVSPDT